MKINGIEVKSYYKADGVITGYCKLSKYEIKIGEPMLASDWVYPNGEQPKFGDSFKFMFGSSFPPVIENLHNIEPHFIDKIIENKIND